MIVYRAPVFNVWGIYYCYSAPRAGNNLIRWCNSRCVVFLPSLPSHLNAWLRHSICSFVCRFLQAACEVGSSQQESKPSAVPGLVLLLFAFSYWMFYFSLFYNPFRNPPLTFPVESYTQKVFHFLVEWTTFFVNMDVKIYIYTNRILRDSRFSQRCW